MTEADMAKPVEVGLGSHTDLQCFTLLWQDMTGGLQVLNNEGQWIKATPVKDTFVVNIGDFLQRLSNDKFKSTVHRVFNRAPVDRISMPFFFGFNFNETCGVLPTCTDEDNPPKYEPISCGEVCHDSSLFFQISVPFPSPSPSPSQAPYPCISPTAKSSSYAPKLTSPTSTVVSTPLPTRANNTKDWKDAPDLRDDNPGRNFSLRHAMTWCCKIWKGRQPRLIYADTIWCDTVRLDVIWASYNTGYRRWLFCLGCISLVRAFVVCVLGGKF